MATNNLYSENWCDLVFENRNQNYGAYQIRKVTNPNTIISFFGTLLLLGSFVLIPMAIEMLFGDPHLKTLPPDEIPFVPFIEDPFANRPKDVEKPVEKVNPPPSAKTEILTPPEIVETKAAENAPTQVELEGKNVSNVKSDGTGTGEGLSTATGTGKEFVEPAPVEPPPTLEGWQVTELPSFVGGDPEMHRFLLGKIRYPEMEKAEGIEGTVFVSFVVAADGKIINVELARKSSAGFEKEALRVVKLMPNWKPGKDKGRAVNTKMVLPIRFKLN